MSALWLGLCLAGGAQDAPALVRRQTLPLPERVAEWHALDVDGDGGVELITVDLAGRVAVRSAGQDGLFPAEAQVAFALPHPERSLLALLPSGAGLDLVVVDPDGARRRPLLGGGAEPAAEVMLAPGARNRLRTGRPLFVPLVQDVNGDGRFDLVIPDAQGADLWLAGPAAAEDGAAPGSDQLRKAARVPLRVSHSSSADAELLSDVLEEELNVPRLSTEDVNGDGRADLLVHEGSRHAFHLQAADGSFPGKPTVEVDLKLFRDTTPEASVAPGRTLVLGDDASLSTGDVNGDGIPDHVISHRRKVWVFLGGAGGPQFAEPLTILKTAEDVTALVLLDLDQDDYPDLLILKLVVPSIATLVIGMVSSLDVEITALAYHNEEGHGFAKTPSQRGALVLRLPPLLELLKRPEELLDRLEAVQKKYRSSVEGDFDGDGRDDVALLSEDGARLELWRATADQSADDADEAAAWARKLLFEQTDPIFDIDRVLDLLGGFGERRTLELTGARAPDASIAVTPDPGPPLTAALPADVDGDGRAELLLGYGAQDGRLLIEVVELR